MPVTAEYRDWVLELLRPLGSVTGRSMFGGYGLYLDGLFFALIAEDTLYMKVDDESRGAFEAAGSGPFRPFGDERAMQYYETPPDGLEDPAALRVWVDRALGAARRAGAGRKGARKRR